MPSAAKRAAAAWSRRARVAARRWAWVRAIGPLYSGRYLCRQRYGSIGGDDRCQFGRARPMGDHTLGPEAGRGPGARRPPPGARAPRARRAARRGGAGGGGGEPLLGEERRDVLELLGGRLAVDRARHRL